MFERFTDEGRTVVVVAQEQARELGHNYIGTEHILLALLGAHQGSLAAQVLADLRITYDKVRAEILDLVGRGEGAGEGQIPFTPRSKKVLELSLREALRLKSKTIGPEHLLLGLVREGEGLAVQILVKLGADLPRVKEELHWRLSPKARARVAHPPFSSMTPGGAQAADRAVARAGGEPVASQHYLLGLLDAEQSLAAKVLAALGVSREAVEAKVAELGTAGTTDERREQAIARLTRIDVEGDAVVVRLEEPALAARLSTLLKEHQGEVPGLESLWKSTVQAVNEVASLLEDPKRQER